MTTKVRETVERLMKLALADIPDSDTARKNEARNAAVRALKLIDDNKLLDIAGVKKRDLPVELGSFDAQSLFAKIFVMDFDGAIAMIERFRKRTQKISEEKMRNLRRDFETEPAWTEKTQHAARRAVETDRCTYCGEVILNLMWIANPFRGPLVVHVRCLREMKEKERG